MPLAFTNPYRVPKAPFNPWGLDPRQAQQAWTGAPSAGAAAAVSWQPPPGAAGREAAGTTYARTPLFAGAMGGRPAANRPWGAPAAPAQMPTLGFGALRPETQAAVQSAYGRQPAGAQANFAAQYAKSGLFGGLFPGLGLGGPAPPPLTFESLLPEYQAAVRSQYEARSEAERQELAKTYGAQGLLGVLPGLGFGTAQPGWEHLTEAARAPYLAAYQGLTPGGQARVGQAFQTGGLAAATPLLAGGAGPEWEDLTPEVQGQVMAAYQALDPERQATVREKFAAGGLAAAVPWLQGAPEQASYLNYEALSPERQQALLAAMQKLSPAAQAAAAEAYRGQGLTAAERLLGVAPTRYEELSPSMQATALERYKTLTPAQQDIAAQLYQRGGMAGVEPFLRADLANMTYDQMQELLLKTASSRQVKRDVAPAREKTLRDVLPGGGSPIPPAPVGALANRIGTLHGAVRALGRDVQALKGRR